MNSNIEYLYVLVNNDFDWEDIVVFISMEDAIEASIRYPKCRVEIFSKHKYAGYIPTYKYLLNGEYIDAQ
jgi:hypothetical protein